MPQSYKSVSKPEEESVQDATGKQNFIQSADSSWLLSFTLSALVPLRKKQKQTHPNKESVRSSSKAYSFSFIFCIK